MRERYHHIRFTSHSFHFVSSFGHNFYFVVTQIYDLEAAYLEETKDLGNIFSGWENYISKEKVKVRKNISNDERLFSLSSVTSPASRRDDAKAQKL